jgi:hypothetical protein
MLALPARIANSSQPQGEKHDSEKSRDRMDFCAAGSKFLETDSSRSTMLVPAVAVAKVVAVHRMRRTGSRA